MLPTTISPWWGKALSIAAFVVSSFIVAGWWQTYFSAQTVATIAGSLGLVVSTINYILHDIPAAPPSDAQKKAASFLLPLVIALLLFAPHPANAAGRKANPITNALNALAKLIEDDGTQSVALSTQIPELQDYVGQACWTQIALVGQVVKAHPIPVTLQVATDLEAIRLVGLALNKVCANPNCGQMWTDVQNVVSAINPSVIPVSLPSICSKIPVLGTLPASALSATK